MSEATLWSRIAAQIEHTTGTPFRCERQRAVGGGCINDAAVIEDAGRSYFVKLNDARRLPMFEAEADGLNELAASRTVRVPLPVCTGLAEQRAYLVMQYVEFGHGDDAAAELLGRGLAAMHRVQQGDYGWWRINTIGSTPQDNTRESDWVTFWDTHRLGYQLELAATHGYGGDLQRKGARLRAGLGQFFTDYTPPASLLHGDLWSGNYAVDTQGQPVIFDPAVYYGDRETDLAMTELFGGFPARFYHAYREAYPLDPGYAVRRDLYNLYHVLNHLNLFGGGYRTQAEEIIRRLLRELG
jgi:fructosamine-3-kinase